MCLGFVCYAFFDRTCVVAVASVWLVHHCGCGDELAVGIRSDQRLFAFCAVDFGGFVSFDRAVVASDSPCYSFDFGSGFFAGDCSDWVVVFGAVDKGVCVSDTALGGEVCSGGFLCVENGDEREERQEAR